MLAKQLEDLGYSLSYKTLDPGGYRRNSKYEVTLKRGNTTYVTIFEKGWGNRVWSNRPTYSLWTKYYTRIGKDAVVPDNIKLPEELTPQHNIAYQRAVINNFNNFTKAVPPSLDEVIFSLLRDAQCVMNGESFEVFCSNLDFNTDSISDKNCYMACIEAWSGLTWLGSDFEQLNELFQEY